MPPRGRPERTQCSVIPRRSFHDSFHGSRAAPG